jgi:hypothetical protein
MANICCSTVEIHGDVKELGEAIIQSLTTPDGTTDEWIGNFLLHLGMTEKEILDSPIGCRADVTFFEIDNDHITLDIDSAWSPQFTPLMMLCEKYAPEASVFYRAVESGAELYLTNDPDYENSFYCESWGNEELYGFYDRDGLKAEMETILKKQAGFVNLIEEITDTCDVAINKMEYCEIDEL